MADAFDTWIAFLGPIEGGLSLDKNDPGNYRPDGTLVGTKYGISARAYPNEDIPNLTLARANELRKRDYFDKVRGSELPPGVAFVLAEAAYGSGPGTAIKQLQQVVGTAQDGVFGPATMAALKAKLAQPDGAENFLWEYSAQRLLYEASLATWPTYRVGWTRRLFHGLWTAAGLAGVAPPQSEPTPAPAADVSRDTLAAAVEANTVAIELMLDKLTRVGEALAT